jgi:hypothetical protein
MSTKKFTPHLAEPPTGSHARVHRTREDIDKGVALAKANPGQWVIAQKDASPGNTPTYKKRGMETRVSRVGHKNGRVSIYIMWPGEAKA